MLTQEHIGQIDTNNTKALTVVKTTLWALINEAENIDVTSTFEVIYDYLQSTENILNENL